MKLKLLCLLLLPTIALADGCSNTPILSAEEALAKSAVIHNANLRHDTIVLYELANDAIHNAVEMGSYEASFRVTGYDDVVVHAVNQNLRDRGYRIRTFYARLIGERMEVVSWR